MKRPRKSTSSHANGDELQRLRDQTAQAKTKAREVERQHVRAAEQLAELREQRVEAYARGDDAAAERLEVEVTEAEAALAGTMAARVEGARRAGRRAEQEADRYISANYNALAAERAPTDQAAVQSVHAALEGLVAAVATWHEAQSAHDQLLRPTGRTDTRTPSLGAAADLARDATRVLAAGIPSPAPHGPSVAHTAPEQPTPNARAAFEPIA